MSAVESSGQAPSGEQHVISYGDARVDITQVGATLRSYTVGEWDVIDGFGVDQRAHDGRGQVLAPWPNRLTDGRYRYGGRECQAPLNEPGRHDAIHGLVRWSDWSLVSRSASTVTLAYAVRPQPGYDWRLDLALTYALDDSGLTVTLRASNAGTERAPFGAGFHPYLALGGASIDGLDLIIPAAQRIDPSGAGITVSETPLDFTRPRTIGATRLDTALGGLMRGDDGRAVATLCDPAADRSTHLWVDKGYRYLMVYTADLVGDPDRQRTAVAVEPMTCPPDALRTGTDLVELDPGESWQASWGLRPDRPATS